MKYTLYLRAAEGIGEQKKWYNHLKVYTHTHTHTHTHTPTCMHTYIIHTYMPTCIHTYISIILAHLLQENSFLTVSVFMY